MVKPDDFFVMATWLQGAKQDEMALRTVINRAYYAAFLEFARYADLLELPEVRGGVHEKKIEGVIALWLPRDHPDYSRQEALRKSAYLLNEIKSWRVKSDYRLDRSIYQANAKEVVARVIKIRNLLTSLGTPRSYSLQ
ncbi:MAG: hypothetical protein G8345_09980 [Magnetococcales bacterium]|nr:hypothetical protein [Magnetococcales bacterium]NGZ27199.1 hypothetical protein [Magnetococcales bacterium]